MSGKKSEFLPFATDCFKAQNLKSMNQSSLAKNSD